MYNSTTTAGDIIRTLKTLDGSTQIKGIWHYANDTVDGKIVKVERAVDGTTQNLN